jgi:membrane protease YdiL (CAAX protease family)
MPRHSVSLSMQYGVAMLAAPMCCILSALFFESRPENIFWIFGDLNRFFVLILVYPLVEELAFRGVIQGFLGTHRHTKESWAGITYANLLTTVLFVLIHFIYHPPTWALAVFVPSLIFGYFKDRFGSVIPSIFLHSFYNAVFYAYMGN